MPDFRDKLVEAHSVLKQHMQDFVQMQFNVELNMQIQSEKTAGPIFMWEPSVDLILQTQDSVVTGVEHLNEHARNFLVRFFSSMSNSIMSSGVINDSTILPWKGVEVEGTIFNGQYGWEDSEFIDFAFTTRPSARMLVGVMSVRDHDITLKSIVQKASLLCDYIVLFVHKPTKEVEKIVVQLKEELGTKLIVRGILSRSASETYLYPLCRTDCLIVPLSTDSFWSDNCITEMSNIMRQMDVSGYRGIDIQNCVMDVLEIKSHPPDAIGMRSDLKTTYMGNVTKWSSTESSIGGLTKNTCTYRDNVTKFANVNVAYPGILCLSHMNLSSTVNFSNKPTFEFLEKADASEKAKIDASSYMSRKIIVRLMRGSARWSVYST